MFTDFNKITDRNGTSCIKWDFREEIFGNSDLIPFSIADSDFATPDFILDALKKRIDRKILGYTNLDASYKEAVAMWCKSRHDIDIDGEWITSTAGVMPAVSAAVGAFLNKGDKVLIQTPVYDPFESVARAGECEVIYNELKKDNEGRYKMDFEDLKEKFSSGVRMMILCSPHNPVGRVWTEDELKTVVELCRTHDVILVSDEIHWDIVMPGFKHIPILKFITEDDKAILCTAPSKTFNIAGLDTSNVIIRNPQIREKFRSWLFGKFMFGANVLGLCACEAAYRNGSEWVDEQNRYLKDNADLLKDFFRANIPKAVVTPTEGTYLAWIDLTYTGLTSDELIKLMAVHGAGLNNGKHYGKQCDGFVRMNIACPRALLKKGLSSIREAIETL